MTDERQSGLMFESWLKGTDPTPPDASRSVAEVMDRVPQVRQRGRWWPLPAFPGKAKTPTTDDMTKYQPSPIPATNGHAPTVIGRTQTMLSPIKAITVGAVVFALGGMFLIAQPFDQQSSVPGAEQGADPMAPAMVTGSIPEMSETFGGFVSPAGDTVERKGYSVTERWEASDPRLSGTSTFTTNFRQYASADVLVLAGTRVIENDDGRWVGTETGLGSDALFLDTIVLHGEDAYEGLTAYVVLDVQAVPHTFDAAIFPGEMPELPEPAE